MYDLLQQIEDCNRQVFKTPIPDKETRLSASRKEWALSAFREETKEFEDATTLIDELDACCDLAIFALGRIYEMGANAPAHLREVMRANFDKKAGRVAQRDPGEGYFDGEKPAGWQGPDHEGVILKRHLNTFEPPYRIILVGHGRHGKDTVAEILRSKYGYQFTSSSLACAETVMLPAFADKGKFYIDAGTCFNDRHGESYIGDHRTFWFETIKAFCTPDKARLAQAIFDAGNHIYVGIRDRRELWAAQLMPDVITIWVDASDRLPPEQGSSMNIEPWMANRVLDNNGSLEDLERNVIALATELHK